MKNICDWIEDKIYDRSLFSDTCDDAAEFGMLAGVLRAQAAAEGYCLEELEHACQGDVSTYLMMAHNSLLTGSSGTMDQAFRGYPSPTRHLSLSEPQPVSAPHWDSLG